MSVAASDSATVTAVPVSSLPPRPHLDHLKTQAKELLASYRLGEAPAVARVDAYFAAGSMLTLAQAQLVIAREYGFPSWAKLKAHVELRAPADSLTAQADRFVEAAVWEGKSDAARALLTEVPAIGAATLPAACVTGDVDAVARFLDADPTLLNAKLAPKQWEPLLYVCFSHLLKEAAFRPRLIETARRLIARGADVNAHWPNREFDDCPESCLYGATGVNDCPELARLLLDAGANPNDGECLYHSTELPTWDCLRLLMENGGSIGEVNALAHMLDREEPEWVRMMLSFAKNAADIPPILPFALRRGRSAEVCQILIDSGMDLNTPDKRQGGGTPYQVATRLGRTDVAAMLEVAGADTMLTPTDALLGRLARGEQVAPESISAEMIASLNAEKPTPTLVVLAECGQAAALEPLLAAGANPNVVDANGWTPLHVAAMNGYTETVRALLRHGADPTLRDRHHNGTPVGFACYRSTEPGEIMQSVFVEIVTDLLDAGAPNQETAWGSPEVQALLVARGAKPVE